MIDLDFIEDLSDGDLSVLVHALNQERIQRLVSSHDPETLANMAMEQGFDSIGNPIPPRVMVPGIVALTSVVKDMSAGKHRCTHFTVKMSQDSAEEFWSWDDASDTLIYSETGKVDTIRRSVALHALPDGAVILMHVMKHDGFRHERTKVQSWDVHMGYDTDSDEPQMWLTASSARITKLPPPNNAEEG